MRKALVLLFLIGLFPLLSHGQSQEKSLKLITYNIWNGFDWGKDPSRRAELQEWVSSRQPDIVALQELCEYTPEKLEEDARAWGHKHSILLKTSGYSVGLTSKYPIEVKEKIFEGLHHGALHCKTNNIDFLVVHLHPGSIERRRDEAKVLIKKLEQIQDSNSRYVVLGDFNSHSPFDADLYASDGPLLNRLRKSNIGKGLSGNIVNESLDYAVLSTFLSFPLYDVVRDFTKGISERGSFPARALGPINGESGEELDSRLERIDYILVSPALAPKAVDAKVWNGKETWNLSDHYPVEVVFELVPE